MTRSSDEARLFQFLRFLQIFNSVPGQAGKLSRYAALFDQRNGAIDITLRYQLIHGCCDPNDASFFPSVLSGARCAGIFYKTTQCCYSRETGSVFPRRCWEREGNIPRARANQIACALATRSIKRCSILPPIISLSIEKDSRRRVSRVKGGASRERYGSELLRARGNYRGCNAA